MLSDYATENQGKSVAAAASPVMSLICTSGYCGLNRSVRSYLKLGLTWPDESTRTPVPPPAALPTQIDWPKGRLRRHIIMCLIMCP